MPLVSLTRATLRNAEFGFFGVCVYTRVQTPRFCGQDCRAGLAVLYFGAVRPLRTSWLNVGTLCSSFVLHASSKLAHGLTPQQNSWRQPWPHLCACALSIALDAHRGTRFIPTIGTGQPLRGLSDRSAHASPHATSGGVSVSDQVRRTTVAPWSFRKPARKPVRRSGTRALRFVASACIPTGKLQRKRRHVSARTSCKYHFYRIEINAAQPHTTGRPSMTRRTHSI